MMTARQLAVRLARHIGVSSFDPGHRSNNSPLHQPGLRGGDLLEMVACLNTALYEVWEMVRVKEGKGFIYLHAPAQVALELTVGEREIRQFADYEPWMKGCRIVLPDQPNRVVNPQELHEPYAGLGEGDGTAVTVNATVYHDLAVLDEAVEEFHGSVLKVEGGAFLVQETRERTAFETLMQGGIDGGEVEGKPRVFFFERGERRATALFFPAPDREMVFPYTGAVRMIEVRPADIGVTEDPRVPLRALVQMRAPGGWDLEVVFPLALQRLSLHPSFESRLAKDEIRLQAEQARAKVRRYRSGAGAGRGDNVMVPLFR